jgi:hypothetical protein
LTKGLRARGVDRTWTIVGAGPDEERLREMWSGAPAVQFTGTLTNAETVDRLADRGVPAVVELGVTGFRPAVADVAGFVDAFQRLAADRRLLEQMSKSCRRLIEAHYDVRARAADYQALYARYQTLYRPLSADATLQYGSRLDQPWIPNGVVKAVRTAVARKASR